MEYVDRFLKISYFWKLLYFFMIMYALQSLNMSGLLVGLCTFLIIGLFHPLVIKGEYYFGVKCWWAFLILGIVCTLLSVFIANQMASTMLGVTAFSSFWSILEVFHQRKRVEKGWFPKNPKRRE